MKNDKPVLFYGHTEGEFAAFSNFYPAEFDLNGWTWACSEQAYMYFKSSDKDYQYTVKRTKDPYVVKKLGRKAKLIPSWDSIKFGVMICVLEAKFSQNQDLKELLLSTGDRKISENCSDPWWGGGPNFPNGKDLLGKALMKVRATLRLEDSMNDSENFETVHKETEELEDFDLNSASRNISFTIDSEGEIPAVDIGLIFKIEE